MIWLRAYLLAGLVVHKLVWEVLRRRTASGPAVTAPLRPIKLVKIALLVAFLAQTVLPPVLPISAEPGFQVVLGTLLFTLGLGVAVAARVRLGRNWSNVESATVLQDHSLVAEGLYRHIRHPIYLGDLLLVTGLELALNSWLVLLALPLAVYIRRKAIEEERALERRLPGYSAYLVSSGRFLPPCLAVGLTVLAVSAGLQSAMIYGNFGGNWSALYLTGAQRQPPPVQGENLYVFAGSKGYDGQFYHYIAHDPLMRRGTVDFIDAPRLRYVRILMPGLAFLLGWGRDAWIDAAFFTVNLLALALTGWFLARIAVLGGLNRWWGLAIFAVPGVWISLDRIIVDVLLAPLTAAFVLAVLCRPMWGTITVLALAGLARETGLALWGAYGLYLLLTRQIRKALLVAGAVAPLAAWWVFVVAGTPPYQTEIVQNLAPPSHGAVLYSAMLQRFLEPAPYRQLSPHIADAARTLDYIALTGALLATLCAFYWFGGRWRDPLRLTAVVLGLIPWVMGGMMGWHEPFGYPRSLTMLFVLLLYAAMETRRWWYALPMLLVLPRIAMQLAPHLPGVRGLM